MTISDSNYARQATNMNHEEAVRYIDQQELIISYKGEKLTGKDGKTYNKEIKARVDAIRAKVLAAKNDPKQAHLIYKIASDGCRELDRFVDTFWGGREVAAKKGQTVSDQFAKIHAAAAQVLTTRDYEQEHQDFLLKGAAAGAGAGLGMAVGTLWELMKFPVDNAFGKRVVGCMAAGGVAGWALGEALTVKEAH